MSRNDQLLVKEHGGKFYIFSVMAESWDSSNKLSLDEALGVFDAREEAHQFAHKHDAEDEMFGSEYGVVDEVLAKDGQDVKIVGSKS